MFVFYIGSLPTASFFSSVSVLHAVQMFLCAYFSSGFLEQSRYSLECISFFTITLFYTNNRLLCCCPLNLEKKNPTLQMSHDRGGLLLL